MLAGVKCVFTVAVSQPDCLGLPVLGQCNVRSMWICSDINYDSTKLHDMRAVNVRRL